MPTRDKWVETYDSWLRANDQHKDLMSAVMNGQPLDEKAMHQKTAEVDRLHEDWMLLAKKFSGA